MSRRSPRQVRSPPYALQLDVAVDEAAVTRMAALLDDHMGWSGRPSRAAIESVTYVLGLLEWKMVAEKKRKEHNGQG